MNEREEFVSSPADILVAAERLDIQRTEDDWFLAEDAFAEKYFFGATLDTLRSQVAFLMGAWTGDDPPINTGLLIFSNANELGWAIPDGEARTNPHWWTIISSGLTTNANSTRAVLPPTPVQRYVPPPRREGPFFSLVLDPPARISVSFDSAELWLGEQPDATLDNLEVRFSNETIWRTVYRSTGLAALGDTTGLDATARD